MGEFPRRPVAFLGIGQAGGNIVANAQKFNFLSGAINLCREDMDPIRHLVKNSFHFKNSFGAGKDRSEAIRKIKEEFEPAVEWIIKQFDEPYIEHINVVFSTGGGTGGGLGPLTVDVMSEAMPHKKWGAIMILPFRNEGWTTHANTIKCVEEYTELQTVGACSFIDNEKVSEILIEGRRASRNEVFKTTNEEIIRLYDKLFNITRLNSQYGNFDLREFLNLIGQKGNMIMTQVKIPEGTEITEEVITELINEHIDMNIFANIEYDKNILMAGIIYETDEKIFGFVNNRKIFKNIGEPPTIYQGFYPSGKNVITIVLSGLSYPFKVLSTIDDEVTSNEKNLEEKIHQIKTQKFVGRSTKIIELLSNRRLNDDGANNNIGEINKAQSLKEKLNKYK